MFTARRYVEALMLVLLLAACGDDDVKPESTATRKEKENGTVTPHVTRAWSRSSPRSGLHARTPLPSGGCDQRETSA